MPEFSSVITFKRTCSVESGHGLGAYGLGFRVEFRVNLCNAS